MPDRQSILLNLISFNSGLVQLRNQVASLSWDSEEELVFLTKSHVKDVLNRFLQDDLTREDVNDWANMIEMREDIGFAEGDEEELKELIFELANPEITHELNANRASELVRGL